MKRPALLLSVLFLLGAGDPLFAQPGFDQYLFTPNLGPEGITLDEYQDDPVAFRARYFPKLTIPVKREDYFGVFNFYNHGTYPTHRVYDGDPDKQSYFFCQTFGQTCGHKAVDWLVGYRNFGANEVINPFPAGAVVVVSDALDYFDDVYIEASFGNFVELTCFLDGNPNNTESVNRLVLKLAHLKAGSILVRKGQFVNPGQVLGQIGYSGTTGLSVTHVHAAYSHRGRPIDPFFGPFNPDLSASMFFDQTAIEDATNWQVLENRRYLTLNDQFYVTMPNQRTNIYSFRAEVPIRAIRIEDRDGQVVTDYDVLDNPDLQDVRSKSYTFRDAEGNAHTIYEVSFRWFQNADPSVLNREIPFLIETDHGAYSNRVFVKVI